MKKVALFVAGLYVCFSANAQLTTIANGTSVKASVSERVGLTDVTINYGRPAVKGREGKVWGELVHTGFKYLGYGNGKESPWRAGANENTTIEFSTEVSVEGKLLAAGKYGFFIAYYPGKATLIFSKATENWGSYFYDPAEDVLRVDVKPLPRKELKERLTYEFSNETDSTATISLEWELLAIPFSVTTKLHQLQMASFERELKGDKGSDPHAWVQVADYLSDHNGDLEGALTYIDRAAASMPVFSVSMSKAEMLEKLNRQAQADSLKKVAIGNGSPQEVHNYARKLQREGKKQQAFEVFQQNYKHYPNTYTTNVGLVRGYSGIGKTKDALKYAGMALPQAPDANNKKAVEDMITKLKAGKEI